MTDLSVGARIAGYRIEGIAGRGGMGVVYRARQLRPERVVALKVIAPELSGDEAFRGRFESESELAASIEHPNVIPVYDVGEGDGRLYIAMRLVDGADLRGLITAGLARAAAVRIVAQVGSALDAAHAHGLIHRDVKPANVLVAQISGGDHAYLTDFGLAKRLSAGGGQTRTGEFIGTVDYVAPEQVTGGRVDARADVYALACVLFHAVTGRVPYPRDSDMARLWAHVNEPPPSAADAGADVPPPLDQVIARGMARDPDDRHRSAGDLGRAALAALEGQDPGAIEERTVAIGPAAPDGSAVTVLPGAIAPAEDRAGTPATAAAPTATPRAEPAADRRSRRMPALVALGVLVAAAVVAIVVLGGGSGDGDGEAPPQPEVVGAPIPVGREPAAVAVGAGSVWVANARDDTVSRIDAATGAPAGDPIPVGDQPYGVAVGEGAVWVVNFGDDTLQRIDPARGRAVGRPVRVGDRPADVAVGFGAVWVANYGAGTVTKVDPATGRAAGRPIPVRAGPADVATGAGSVWTANVEDDTVSRINPTTAAALGAPIPANDAPESIAVGASAWVTNIREDTVTRIDPVANRAAGTIDVGERPDDVVLGDGVLWVANADGNSVERLDLETGAPVGDPLAVGDRPAALALGGGLLWVVDAAGDSVVRVRP